MAWSHRVADILVDLAVLGVASYLTYCMLGRSGRRSSDSDRPHKKGTRAAQQSLLTQRLLSRHSRNSRRGLCPNKKPVALRLNEYEIEVAADMLTPSQVGVSFSQIGGLDEQARHLKHSLMLPLRRPNLFGKSKLLRPPTGILMHGPPGTVNLPSLANTPFSTRPHPCQRDPRSAESE